MTDKDLRPLSPGMVAAMHAAKHGEATSIKEPVETDWKARAEKAEAIVAAQIAAFEVLHARAERAEAALAKIANYHSDPALIARAALKEQGQ